MMLTPVLPEKIVGRARHVLAAVFLVMTFDTQVSAQSASWTVETTPQLQIGRESGPPEYLFSRVVGVRRLADGRVVVGEGTDPSIRFYSAQGIFADKHRAIVNIHVDPTKHVWVEQLPAYRAFNPVRDGVRVDNSSARLRAKWDVFSPEGVFRFTVEMPAGLEISDIGSDYVAGVWRDELGVPQIRIHRLVRNSSR